MQHQLPEKKQLPEISLTTPLKIVGRIFFWEFSVTSCRVFLSFRAHLRPSKFGEKKSGTRLRTTATRWLFFAHIWNFGLRRNEKYHLNCLPVRLKFKHKRYFSWKSSPVFIAWTGMRKFTVWLFGFLFLFRYFFRQFNLWLFCGKASLLIKFAHACYNCARLIQEVAFD